MTGERTIKRSNPKSRNLINDQIQADEVRLIAADGSQRGIVSLADALKEAEAARLDLVQITDSDPVVCKVMDYGKKLFEAKKAKAAAKKKQKQAQVKEIKFRPTTEEGDYQVKLRSLIRFLEQGDKTKVSLRFRGREMAHQDIGAQLMQRVVTDLAPYGAVEQEAKVEGRQMVMVLTPVAAKKR